MNRILHITSPIPPSVNHYIKHRAFVKNGKAVPQVYETKEAKEYKETFELKVISAVNEQHWDMPLDKNRHFYVDAYYYFDRKDRDASNYEKCLCDAITETQKIWIDDNVVLYRPQRILYDRNNPRIELYISPVDYIGIFGTEEDMDRFTENCQTCSRCMDKCSELKKAKEGVITGNITPGQSADGGYICSKYRRSKKEDTKSA